MTTWKLIFFVLFFTFGASAYSLECKTEKQALSQLRQAAKAPKLIFEGYSKFDKSGGGSSYYQIFMGIKNTWGIVQQTVTFLRNGEIFSDSAVCYNFLFGGRGIFPIPAGIEGNFFEKNDKDVKLNSACATLENFSGWVISNFDEFPRFLLKVSKDTKLIFYGGENGWTLAVSKDIVLGLPYDRCYGILAAGGLWHIHEDRMTYKDAI